MRTAKLIRPTMICALLICALAGCGGSREVNVESMNAETVGTSRSDSLNALMINPAMQRNADPNSDYVIGPEDLLDIEVFQADELKKTVRVSSQGYIGLPLLGQIKAKGLTPQRLEQEIAARLTKYLEEPLVSVYVREYKAQKIGVIGAVTNPQVFAVTGQRYLLEMVSMAGGLSRDAGTICYVLRPTGQETGREGETKTETIVIDLGELLEKGNTALNIPVFGGDVINVPKGGVFFVDGAVERAGVFPLQGKMTLVQAIATSGGTRFEAENSGVKILRDDGEGGREILAADYSAIRSGAADDIPIKDKDIIIVPTSGVKGFLAGFVSVVRGFVTFGTIR